MEAPKGATEITSVYWSMWKL